MAGKLMRYPTDMIDSSMDYFKIEILKNIKTGGGISGLGGSEGGLSSISGTGNNRASQVSDQYNDKPAEKTIILPIPGNIQAVSYTHLTLPTSDLV